jgi:hypothetical protein
MKKSIINFILIVIPILTIAQTGAVGEWIDYSPYSDIFKIAVGTDKVYAAGTYGLLEYDIPNDAITRFSKTEGLSDVNITCLGYNAPTNTFVIGYKNGKIDLIRDSKVTTIADLQRKSISGNKSLNNVYMDSVFAYFATGFGIVKFNVERKEFSETYIVTENGDYTMVNDVTVFKDTVYAATENGVRKAAANSPSITFYQTWETETSLDPTKTYSLLESTKDYFYATIHLSDTADSLVMRTPSTSWENVNNLVGKEIRSLQILPESVLIGHEQTVSTYDTNWNEINRIFNYGEGTFVNSNDAFASIDGTIWIGDRGFGFIKNPKPFWFNLLSPSSPAVSSVDDIDFSEKTVAIAAGLRQENWSNTFSNDGVMTRDANQNWSQITKFNDPGLNGVFDIITVQYDPFNPDIFFGGSLGNGLVEFEKNKVKTVFNTTNSTLQNANGIEWVGVTGIDFDNQGNMWVANSGNSQAISVRKYDGEWTGFSFPQYIIEDNTGDLIVDQNNYKWLVLPRGKGLIVFNDNGTIDDESDDEVKFLNNATGQGGLPSSEIYSIAEDHDGEIWVGTNEGIGVFYSPTSIFSPNSNFDAQQIIVEVNGYFQYLLGTESVTAIAVDGANRKWLGTKGSGVFLMSSDGTQELYHFTAENSPLLSNFIRTIKINPITGEVLIGTNSGISAFKGTATDEEALQNEPYAYPNPVPNNYYGLIAIKGLPVNSEVRITDISGNMVFQTVSEGTQAVWDGNDMNGQRVATGVYMVFGIDTEGNNSKVAKILFTR